MGCFVPQTLVAMSGNKFCRHTAGIYRLHLGDRVRHAAEHPTVLRTALNNKGVSGPPMSRLRLLRNPVP